MRVKGGMYAKNRLSDIAARGERECRWLLVHLYLHERAVYYDMSDIPLASALAASTIDGSR